MVVGFGIGMELENKASLCVFHCRTTSCIGFRVMPLILCSNFWGDTFWSFDLRLATRSFAFKRVHHFVWILLGSKHHFQLEIRHGSANGRVQSILMGCHALFPRTASYFPLLSNEGAAGAVLVQPIEALSHPPCHTGWKKHHGKHRLGGENAKLWAKTSLVANPWVQQSLGVKQVRV